MMVIGFAFVLICFICSFLESGRTATYKWFGVYGRFSAYLALDLTMAGILAIIGSFFPQLIRLTSEPTLHWISTFLIGLGLLFIGLFLYLSAYETCPEVVRRGCIPSMIISGCGVVFKTTIFFLFFVWKMSLPKMVRTIGGTDYMVMGSDVYNTRGELVGRLGADGNSIVVAKELDV